MEIGERSRSDRENIMAFIEQLASRHFDGAFRAWVPDELVNEAPDFPVSDEPFHEPWMVRASRLTRKSVILLSRGLSLPRRGEAVISRDAGV